MTSGLLRKLLNNMECGIGRRRYADGLLLLQSGRCRSLSIAHLKTYTRLRCCSTLATSADSQLGTKFSTWATSHAEEKTLTTDEASDRVREPKLTVVAFDIETTGFKSEGHRIIEFAARDLSGGQSSTMSALVNPGRYVPHMISQITGITNEMVNQPKVPSWREVGLEVIRFIESRRQGDQPLVLVAHNGRTFDVPFLLKEFQSCSIEVPGWWLFLDSMSLARETKKKHRYKWPSLKLGDLYDSYGLRTCENAHRAMTDVNMLASVLEMLVADLQMHPTEFLSKSFNAEDVLATKRVQGQSPAMEGEAVVEAAYDQGESGKDIDPEIIVDEDMETLSDGFVCGDEPPLSRSFLDTGSVNATVLSDRLRKYVELKRERPDFLHLLVAGEFYEAYFEDAEVLSTRCKIMLTSVNDGEVDVQFTRFPACKSYRYFRVLLDSGVKIVKVDLENSVKSVSVLTPGMLLQEGMFDECRNNYLVSVNIADDASSSWGLAGCDLSTGELYATQSKGVSTLVEELYRLETEEAVLNLKALSVLSSSLFRSTQTYSEFSSTTEETLLSHLLDAETAGSLCKWHLANCAAKALLRYVQQVQGLSIQELPMRKLITYNAEDYLFLDRKTRDFLKLLNTGKAGNEEGSLIWAMDNTKTLMGSRLLRKWLLQPLKILEQIRLRQDAVKVLVKDSVSRGALRCFLTSVMDIERVAGSLVSQRVISWGDMHSLSESLFMLPKISLVLEKLPESFYFFHVRRHEAALMILADKIQEKSKEHSDSDEQADNIMKETNATIEREQDMLEVQKAVSDSLAALQETSHALAALDVLCSLAETAATRHYCIPELIDGRQIAVIDARHPVVEVVKDFTPNTVYLGHEPGSSTPDLLVVTGHKGSGKSCYLQEIALIQVLAQCGSFVPAKEARLSIADAIYTSGWSDINAVLEKATSNSLVLLDDFGPPVGVKHSDALSTAVIEYLTDHVNARSLLCMENCQLDLHRKYSNISTYHIGNYSLVPGLVVQEGELENGRYPEWILRRAKELVGAEGSQQQLQPSVVEDGKTLWHKFSTAELSSSTVLTENETSRAEDQLGQLWQQVTTMLQSSPATLALAKQKGSLLSVSRTSEPPAIVRIGSSPVFVRKFKQQEHAAALEAAFESLLNQPVRIEVLVEQSE